MYVENGNVRDLVGRADMFVDEGSRHRVPASRKPRRQVEDLWSQRGGF